MRRLPPDRTIAAVPRAGRGTAAALLRDRRGVTAAEYAILAVGVVLVAAGAVVLLGDPVNGAFARVGSTLMEALDALIGTAAR